MNLKNKLVTVVGLGRSGRDAVSLLRRYGAKVKVTDTSKSSSIKREFEKIKESAADMEFGGHTEGFLSGSELVVISPGVPLDSLPVLWAKAQGVPVIGEVELAFNFCKAPIIAVTGSVGKSTTASLISHILNKAGKRAILCGNIGNSFCGEILKCSVLWNKYLAACHSRERGNPESKNIVDSRVRGNDSDKNVYKNFPDSALIVLEVSSFQLETIRDFKPKIGVFLNVVENHLDRYGNFKDYLEAKKRLFMNQSADDIAILNYKDKTVRGLADSMRAEVRFCNTEEDEWLDRECLDISFPLLNVQAAFSAAQVCGLDKEVILKGIRTFKPLEHRFEFAGEAGGVRFINDSKATTPDSVVWAVNAVRGDVILIAGGRDKGMDFRILADVVREKVKRVILIGEMQEKLRHLLNGTAELRCASSMEEAVRIGYEGARAGDTILLSPGCLSLDMFESFEERGREFKKIVWSFKRE